MIHTHFSRNERIYTGIELKPHFLLTEYGLKGSALGAFIGPTLVRTEHLVDWEDRLQNERIEARRMVHFLGEFFGVASLREGVLAQRLIMAQIGQSVNEHLLKAGRHEALVRRDGDDLFSMGRKLSVSIVTASPVSQLLHIGINVDPEGAPVPAIGLSELGIIAEEWVPGILKGVAHEWESMDWACAKVRPVM